MVLKKQLKKAGLYLLTNLHKSTEDRLSVIRIRLGMLKGKKMILNLNSGNGQVDTAYLTGYRQEKEEAELLQRLVKKGQTVWDIGIYRGFYTLLFADWVGTQGKVHAFDIDQRNCRVVKEVMRLNEVKQVVFHNCGLSNENTEAKFISSPSSNSRLISTFRGRYTEEPVLTNGEEINTVQLRSLNSLIEEMGTPDLIKMDIDGAELFALDTADKIFSNPNLIFVIESHNESTDQKITEFLNRHRCLVFSINDNRYYKNGELYGGTTISCRRDADHLQKLIGG